jgi:hypothetical protein
MAKHKVMTEKEVAEWLGCPEATLRTHRFRPPKDRAPLPHFKLPNGKIAYREDQVNLWIENAEKDALTPRARQPRRTA